MDTPQGKYLWTAKVGEKGQIVIPKEARTLFKINPGETVLLLGDIDRGIALVNYEGYMKFAEEILAAGRETENEA